MVSVRKFVRKFFHKGFTHISTKHFMLAGNAYHENIAVRQHAKRQDRIAVSFQTKTNMVKLIHRIRAVSTSMIIQSRGLVRQSTRIISRCFPFYEIADQLEYFVASIETACFLITRIEIRRKININHLGYSNLWHSLYLWKRPRIHWLSCSRFSPFGMAPAIV